EDVSSLSSSEAQKLGSTLSASVRRRSSGRFTLFESDEILADRYRIIEELGRGAMGIVYRAWDLKLQREVALKTLREESDDDPIRSERFRREIESLSGLQHPHIVGVHDAGLFEDRFWFVMDCIEGKSLAEVLKNESMEPRRAFKLLLPIADAVAYAHSKGIVHRDIKPENILIDAKETPYLTDFGLACRLSQESRLTATGHTVGTPAFMAPEQIVGSHKPGEATDIYAIGATLYECLTGSLPFAHSENYAELVYAIVHNEPIAPRSVKAEIARDAELICLACLEKEPSHRYENAHALTQDFERFLRGEAVRAHSSPWWRVARTLKRHWSLALGLSIGLAGLFGALGFVLSQRKENERNRRVTKNLERERETLLRVYKRTVEDDILRSKRNGELAQTVLWRGTDWDLQCFDEVSKVDPSYWQAHYWKAHQYIDRSVQAIHDNKSFEAQQWGRKALQELKALHKVGPRNAAYYILEAALYGQLFDDWDQARKLYRQAIEVDDRSPGGLFARASVLRLGGDQKKALSVINELCKKKPAPLAALLLQVELLAMTGQNAKASVEFSKLKKLWPETSTRNVSSLWLLGFNQWNLSRLQVLLDSSRSQISKDSWSQLEQESLKLHSRKNEWSAWLLSNVYLSQKKYEESEALLESSVEVHPQSGLLWALKAKLALETKQSKEAERCLSKSKDLAIKAFRYKAPSRDIDFDR
ncbi:MAG: protein kinase, partial [Planctomycetota bacterium]|nr:protein kinase [Planctomycetota bacterium]